jgi:hypothetical protein
MALSIFYHHGATAVYDDGIVCPTVQRFLFFHEDSKVHGVAHGASSCRQR